MPLPKRVVEFGAAAIEEIEHLRKQRDELQEHNTKLVEERRARQRIDDKIRKLETSKAHK